MCKLECPCSPKGLMNLDKFDEDSASEFLGSQYIFTGTITNFYECYKKLILDEKLEKLDDSVLKNIQELETNMDCQGICQKSKFWFFKDITEGDPR